LVEDSLQKQLKGQINLASVLVIIVVVVNAEKGYIRDKLNQEKTEEIFVK
jgi:hypothetical protein